MSKAVSEPFDDTGKVFFRDLFHDWGIQAEIECTVFHRARTIDLVVDCDRQQLQRLEETAFSHFRLLNSLELKGPADPLTLEGYNLIMMRAWGLGVVERSAGEQGRTNGEGSRDGQWERGELPTNRTVTILCVVRPDSILRTEELGFRAASEPGVYVCEERLSTWIIVPSEVALARRNYPLLPFAKGKKLQDFVDLCAREGETTYLRMALEAGSAVAPEAMWPKLMEMLNMEPVYTPEILEIIDQIIQKFPDKLPKSAKRRAEVIEENARAAEKLAIERALKRGLKKGLKKGHEEGLEEGREKGLEEGLERGELQARQQTLLRQARHKFGAIEPMWEQRIRDTTDVTLLDGWIEKILDVTSLQELAADRA